jgi:transketolase
MTTQSLDTIKELAQQLRVDSIRCSTQAGSGHPTSSMSANDAHHPASVVHLAVRELPGSGTPAELMQAAGISASCIADAARRQLGM